MNCGHPTYKQKDGKVVCEQCGAEVSLGGSKAKKQSANKERKPKEDKGK